MTTFPNRILVVPTALSLLHVHEAGPSDGPVALLWPSLFSNGETSWGAQLSDLHDLGWRTLLIDPPGTGDSPPASRSFTMEECAEAALRVLDSAAVADAVFLGLSWGGMVALQASLIAPNRVTAMVLSNTTARGAPLHDQLMARLNAFLIRIGIPGGAGRAVVSGMLSDRSRKDDPSFACSFKEHVNSLDNVGLAHAVRSVLSDRSSVVDSLDRVAVPTLVIAGAEDRALPADPHSQELAARITGAQLEVLSGVGHLAPRESPTKVSSLIGEFLGQLRV